MFDVYWEPGLNNLADYPTKHHSGKHHKMLRSIYLSRDDSPTTAQGCVKILNYKNIDRAASLKTPPSALHTYNWKPVTKRLRSCIKPVTKSLSNPKRVRFSIPIPLVTKTVYSNTNSENNYGSTQSTKDDGKARYLKLPSKAAIKSIRESLLLIMNNTLSNSIR